MMLIEDTTIKNITGISSYHFILASAISRQKSAYMKMVTDHPKVSGSDEIAELSATITLLLATYIEALINIYLSLKFTEEHFKEIERNGVIDKWDKQPKCFNELYLLNTNLKIVLEDLKDRRDRISHMKPEIAINGKTKTKGKPILIPHNDHELLLEWLSLPERLVRNLGEFDRSTEFFQYQHLSFVSILSK